METGRPQVVSRYSTQANGEDVNSTNICPAALGTKDQQPAAYSPKTGLFYVPTNHVCMDYEPYKVSYTAGQPYVGATVSMYPAPGGTDLGNFIAWDASEGKINWSVPEPFSVWSGVSGHRRRRGVLRHPRGLPEGVDANTGSRALPLQDAIRHHRQRQHLDAQGRAVCRRAVRCRRLGRDRARGRPDCRRRTPRPGTMRPAAAARATRPSTPPASAPSVPTSRSATTPSSAAS